MKAILTDGSARPASARGAARARANEGLTPSFAVTPRDRWQSAGDAVRAVQRLRSFELEKTAGGSNPLVPTKGDVTTAKVGVGAGSIVARDTLQLSKAKKQQPSGDTVRLRKLGAVAHNHARMGDASALARLLSSEPAAASWEDENQVAPLHFASAYGHLSCSQVLAGHGVNVDKTNVWGSTPLINAAFNAHVDVVHFLILQEAQVSIRDKDGTALDGALKQLCRMLRGVCAATDDKHPDKPGLERAKEELNELMKQTNRGPVWHKKLEAAFEPLKPLLTQAPKAVDRLAVGQVDVLAVGAPANGGGAATDRKDAGRAKKEKKADDPEPPDEGRCALYAGCASYVRCIELLRDPAAVRKDEKLRVGSQGGLTGETAADGLTQKVGRIRSALAIDVSVTLPDAIKQANRSMGIDDRGSLPEQATRLIEALGLQ